MSEANRDRLKATFDQDAALYDSIRPGYPERLFDDLVARAELGPEADVLEIGCGTGQATVALARRGFRIVCVELGDALARVARKNLDPFPQVSVVTAPFELWDSGDLTFDLVLAATSWHWIDPDVRYARTAAALKPGGALAVIATHHVLPPDGDRFFAEVQSAYRAIGEEDSPPPPAWDGAGASPPETVADDCEDIEASGLFSDVSVARHLWDRWYTADEYVALLDTYSGHRAMDPSARRWLYDEIRRRIRARPAGRVRKHYMFTLTLARSIERNRA